MSAVPPKTSITISRGPQFGGRFSIVFLIAAILLFFSGINALRDGIWAVALLTLLMALISLAIFLDYQGVQIDAVNERIRIYRSFFGIKVGPWQSMKGFDKLLLKWERSAHRTGSPMVNFISMGGGSKRTDDAYCIYLVNEESSEKIEFMDFTTYKGARKFIKSISKELNLRFEDSYKVIRERAYQRRLERESR